MKPSSQPQDDLLLFQAHFDQLLNPQHPLIQLAGQIDWSHFEVMFAGCYCQDNGAPAKATRLLVFTDTEIQLLDRADPKPPLEPKNTVSHYLYTLARLGGYLSRTHDRPPGNMVLLRGLTRLMDIHLGYCIATGLVGH